MTTHCPSPPLSNPYLTTSGLSEISQRYFNGGKGKAQAELQAQKVEIQQLQETIDSMKSDNERLQSQLNERSGDKERLQSQLNERNVQYTRLQIRCNELYKNCNDLQTLKESLHSQLEKLTNENAELNAQRQKYKKKFVNASTELYFLLVQLGDFLRDEHSYKQGDAMNKLRLMKTRRFILGRLEEVEKVENVFLYVLDGLSRVREDFEKYLSVH